MALILKKSVFLHIPKTGGTWVRKRCEALGILVEEVKRLDFEPGFGFNTTHNVPIYNRDFLSRLKRFTVVRNPVDWYRSYYAYRLLTWWDVDGCTFDRLCKADSFDGFINLALERCPGYLGHLYHSFTKFATHLGKTETIREDFIKFLRDSGERVDEELISPEKENQSDSERFVLSSDQIHDITIGEAEAFRIYLSDSYIPEVPPVCNDAKE